MGNTPSFTDAYRTPGPVAGLYAPAPDRFREKAERDAARRPKDAFAGTGAKVSDAGYYDPFAVKPGAAALKPARSPRVQRTLANGAELHVVAAQPEIVPVQRVEQDEVKRSKRAGKSSSLVLVSNSSLAAAVAEPSAATGGPGELAMPKAEKPAAKPKPAPRSGGGGGGGNGGSGGAGPTTASHDRSFNQDDLVTALIVIAMLLLLALYLFRGGGGPQPAAVEKIVSTQSAATQPLAEPKPLKDPFGEQPVDLTPKSPPPPPVQATVAPAPATPAVADITMHAWFCTAKSELTPATMAALDKQIDAWKPQLAKGSLVIAGYADTRGANDYNVSLSSARATAVGDYLKAKGVKIESASGMGELPDLADNENCSNQRRVDVRLSDGPNEPPSKSCVAPKAVAELMCS